MTCSVYYCPKLAPLKSFIAVFSIIICSTTLKAQEFSLDSVFRQYGITDTSTRVKARSVLGLIDLHRKEFTDAYDRYKKSSKDMAHFTYDYSVNKKEIRFSLAQEKDTFLRCLYYLNYLDLGDGVYGSPIEPEMATAGLQSIWPGL